MTSQPTIPVLSFTALMAFYCHFKLTDAYLPIMLDVLFRLQHSIEKLTLLQQLW